MMNTEALKTALEDLFTNYPSTTLETAERWSQAINSYAIGVFPASVTSSAAKEAFKGVMLGMSAEAMNGLPIFKAAFTQYTTILGAGMTAAGFTGTPPPTSIMVESLVPLGLANTPKPAIIAAWVALIDSYFKTGIATNISTGVPITWT